MKQKIKVGVVTFSFLALLLATPASAAITVGSSTIQGSGDIGLQTSSGNVGIGTASPSYRLDVAGGTTRFQQGISVGSGAPSANYMINLEKSGTVSASTKGAVIYVDVTPDCNCPPVGVEATVSTNGSQNINYYTGHSFYTYAYHTGTSTDIIGLNVYTDNSGPSSTSNMYGIYDQLSVANPTTNGYGFRMQTGIYDTTTNYYSAYLTNPTGAGAITNHFGLTIEALTRATNNAGVVIGEATGTKQTNLLIGTTTQPVGSYSIYNSSADQNYMEGNTGIGTSSPQSALHVPDGKYLQAEDNNAGAPPVGDCDNNAERGRLSIDTSSNRLYICNGATRGWDYISLTD